MLKRLRKLFGLQTAADELASRMAETKTIVTAAKMPTYHEIIPQDDGTHIYRIYRRRPHELLEEGGAVTLKEAQSKAIAAMRKYEGGAQ